MKSLLSIIDSICSNGSSIYILNTDTVIISRNTTSNIFYNIWGYISCIDCSKWGIFFISDSTTSCRCSYTNIWDIILSHYRCLSEYYRSFLKRRECVIIYFNKLTWENTYSILCHPRKIITWDISSNISTTKCIRTCRKIICIYSKSCTCDYTHTWATCIRNIRIIHFNICSIWDIYSASCNICTYRKSCHLYIWDSISRNSLDNWLICTITHRSWCIRIKNNRKSYSSIIIEDEILIPSITTSKRDGISLEEIWSIYFCYCLPWCSSWESIICIASWCRIDIILYRVSKSILDSGSYRIWNKKTEDNPWEISKRSACVCHIIKIMISIIRP